MHIVDGALSNPVVIGGAILAIAGIARGLKDLEMDRIPAAGVLSATFFVAALVHVPIGPSSVHLIMNGIAGLVLGWVAFPALFVGLLLQAVFFGFGGITVLGVNALAIALPAVAVHYLCRSGIQSERNWVAALWGGIAGGMAIVMTVALVALGLTLSGQHFLMAAKLLFFAHLPIVAIEALLCAAAVTLIRQVKPELFGVFSRPLARSSDA
jgi:cobalt/nickel transport system permease protein